MAVIRPTPEPAAADADAGARTAVRSWRWALTARALVVTGVVLALAIGLLVAAQLAVERREAIETAQARVRLLARVLEEHATRSIDTTGVALAALGDAVAAGGGDATPALSQAMSQTLAGLPLLRAVAVADRTGRVLASTSPSDVGRVLRLDRLGPLPAPGRDRLGAFVGGRSLAVLVPGAATDAPAGVGFLPLLRALGGRQGLLLIGLINPDAIANHQQQTLGDEGASAVLATPEGAVLTATAELPVTPGRDLGALGALQRLRSGVEHGTVVGEGVGPAPQVLAWRASRTRPLVVLVQIPKATALEPWADSARLLSMLAAAMAAGVLLMTFAAARGQRGREQAQAEVAEREREMSVIVRSVQELIFRTDAAGRLIFLNARWDTLSATPMSQALTRPLADFVAAESRAEVQALFGLEGAGAQRRALVAAVRDGERRQFDISVTALRDGNAVSGFAGSVVDVTERLAAQARLREQLAFTELLFQMLPLPVSMLDAQGCYVMVNRAWEDATGRKRERVLGTAARSYLPPEEAAFHDAKDAALVRGGGRVQYEATTTLRDGSRRDIAITKAVVPGPGGQPAGVLVAFMDVTESREVERTVREARDAAEEASRAKSEFIANISHELRTPLQAIIGFSELGQARGGATPKLAGMFGDIHAAGQRMLALVNDLLDVAKIESTVGTFHLERTDLRPLVREVTRELEPLLVSRRLHLVAELGDMPLVAKVDPMRYQQVVRNVLANAIRFSPIGARIELEGELTADNQVRLSVRDHGPGIPPAEVEKIFEAFVQSSKTKDGSGGTGLGLAICRKIVEAQGGSIRAANAEGGGSVFHILLPARGFAETQPGGFVDTLPG